MKSVEQVKAQKIIDKIQTGRFDENDVDNLFMRLRTYSSGYPVFREFADLVAHPDRRDRGMVNRSLETMYLFAKYHYEYERQNKILDVTQPFPLWIKKLMKYQVERANEEVLLRDYALTKEKLKRQIDTAFEDDGSTKTACLRPGFLKKNAQSAIQHVMSVLYVNEIFNQDILINELILVIKGNSLTIDEKAFSLQSSRVTLCALLLLHDTKFDIKGHQVGCCRIASETPSVSLTFIPLSEVKGDGYFEDFIVREGSFGNLLVRGEIAIDDKQPDIVVSFPIMTTDLVVEEWCDDSLIHLGASNEQDPHIILEELNFFRGLTLSNNFKLIKAPPSPN